MSEQSPDSESETQKLVQQFRNLHKELIGYVSQVGLDDRERVLFDRWSLKDVLAHITAWNKIDASGFQQAIEGQQHLSIFIPDDEMDEFNARAVEQARILPWGQVYDEFVKSGEELANAAMQLSAPNWDTTTTDPKREVTLRKDFGWSIEHYRDEHIPQLRNFINPPRK